MNVDCSARTLDAFEPRRIDHHTGAEFVVLAEVAVDEVRQYQDHDCTPGQVPADLQAAVVDHLLGGVGVHREHRDVLSGLADLHRHREHRACDGVLRSSHPANLERVLVTRLERLLVGQTSVASSRICSALRPVTTIIVTPAASHTLICSRT